MRPDTGHISLKAVWSILTGAHPFELDIEGQTIRCSVAPGSTPSWPAIEGLTEASDGPWPADVDVACAWEGGQCTVTVGCDYWKTKGKYRHWLGLRARLKGRPRELVWITVPRYIRDAEDGYSAQLRGNISTVKRKVEGSNERARAVNDVLRELLRSSGLPIASASSAEICKVAVPGATIEPSADVAFRRLVHLALLKLDFLDRGEAASERGKPLINVVEKLGDDAEQLGLLQANGDEAAEDEEDDDDQDGDTTDSRERGYWAGGIQWGAESKRDEFVAGKYWQLGWSPSDESPTATVAWRRFARIRVGDWLAIKGYGGRNQLQIHLVGEVTAIHPQIGKVELRPLEIAPYRGPAPVGAGAGSFRDALIPITRADVVQKLFGNAAAAAEPTRARPPIPLNLILYGPPGTGKTFRVTTKYLRYFTRTPAKVGALDRFTEIAAEATWFECIALALKQMNRANVGAIMDHPLVKAKHSLSPTAALRQVVWGTLGKHTVETSQVVKMRQRLGDLIFDKNPDGTWQIVTPLPDEMTTLLERLNAPEQRKSQSKDHTLITFHQAYAYEDFIEGIRPRLFTDNGDEDDGIAYQLEDGVFKSAVKAAVRLTGYAGTLDEFCGLPPDERKRLLAGAPPYALVIDEINRGNVARVLGELITLLEPDKRLGCAREMVVTLPYSRSRFGVPSNLYVIGTMNTADRSVEALDAALRRRFEFEEVAPDADSLDILVENQVDVARLLKTMNRRIEKLFDRDHTIGHAFFESLKEDPSLAALKRVFKGSVLPLLQEYFFGDWGKIGLVLGKDFVTRRPSDGGGFADFDHDDRELLEDRATYELTRLEQLTSASFRRIYEHVSDD